MFLLSAVAYPLVLGALCVGAGLAVDRAAGGLLPGALTAVAGLAALIAVAQLSTYVPGVAPATPYLLLAVGVAGLALGWQRVREAVRGRQRYGWELALPVVVFVVACAPVLFAGRPTFSAYMVLTDSALHMTGADYLIRHGQHYAHLDLVNSYGQYINNYYNRNYPTGADALLGGTSSLLGVPAIWAFQPFNAFMLAVASGPAWLLARHIGLARGWAATAALSAAVPALVYAYDLIGSIKEITALPLILAMGALAVEARWLRSGPRGAIPFALVVAAGVSALGVAFGAWTVVAVAVLAGVAVGDGLLARREHRAAGGAVWGRSRRAGGLRVADLASRLGLGRGRAGRSEHAQPRQPRFAAALDAGVRHLADRQLRGLARRGRPRDHGCADRGDCAGSVTRWRTSSPPAATRAQRLDRTDGPDVLLADPSGRRVGGREDAGPQLTGGDPPCIRGRRVTAACGGGVRARSRSRSCWRAASSPRMPRSTTTPTLRPPPAMTSSPRSTRGSPAAARRCSPTSTSTRSTSCAISTSAGPTSATPRSASSASTRGTGARSTWATVAPLRCADIR